MTIHTFTAVVHKEGRWYVADCPEVGTVSQGRTLAQALANLQEATELYLDEFPLPPKVGRAMVTTFETANA
jgi:predicted RNase H-like HicB family nuclease